MDNRRDLRDRVEPFGKIDQVVATVAVDLDFDFNPFAIDFAVVSAGKAQQPRHFAHRGITTNVVCEHIEESLDFLDRFVRRRYAFLEKPKQVKAVACEIHRRWRQHKLTNDPANFLRCLDRASEVDVSKQTRQLRYVFLCAPVSVWF